MRIDVPDIRISGAGSAKILDMLRGRDSRLTLSSAIFASKPFNLHTPWLHQPILWPASRLFGNGRSNMNLEQRVIHLPPPHPGLKYLNLAEALRFCRGWIFGQHHKVCKLARL